ncbi:MAG: HD domain-containing protein [Sedimentisphaerales bacterium]|nr:HD domain-containing protein [Sedimentisphaerales bacterium]
MREKLIDEMKKVFGEDTKRKNHALAVLDFAEKIQALEGGNALVIQASAILHDIGIQEAKRKYGSSGGKYQEIEGPPIAEKILKSCDVSAGVTRHILRIIANHHSVRDMDTTEFKIIWDADNLVNISEQLKCSGRNQTLESINKIFKTNTGRRMASERFVKN